MADAPNGQIALDRLVVWIANEQRVAARNPALENMNRAASNMDAPLCGRNDQRRRIATRFGDMQACAILAEQLGDGCGKFGVRKPTAVASLRQCANGHHSTAGPRKLSQATQGFPANRRHFGKDQRPPSPGARAQQPSGNGRPTH